MKELKILLASLVVLMIAAYASWARDLSGQKESDEKVTITSASPDDVKSLVMITRTQTVSISRREDAKKEPYMWFQVEQSTSKRGFAGNNEVKSLLTSFAPFVALRSLGALSEKELFEAKLTPPQGKLILRLTGGEKVFEIGGRTYGSRDYYLRAQGGPEVFLVASKVLSDLEYPEGRFMQRKLRNAELKDVSDIVIRAGGKEKKASHKNRHDAKDAYWVFAEKPDERSEELGNYVHKLDSLSASRYGTDEKPIAKGDAVLEVDWIEDGKVLDTVTLFRGGTPAEPVYSAVSGATRVPVEVSKLSAEQLERDLATVFN